MFDLESLSIPGLDTAAGTLTLPLWAAAAAGGLLILFLLLALFRSGLTGTFGALIGLAAVGFGIWMGWTFLERAAERDRAEERRALNARALELTSRALAPGSALACLDATPVESTESACERAVFASPESVAAAAAYVGARLALYADGMDFVRRHDPNYAASLAGLRRAIEVDRFGLVAHVLATRDGCTIDRCEMLSLLRDANRVRSNLNERAFDNVVARHAGGWPARAALSSPAAASGATGLSFPSAASIPPVSIMNAEPAAPPPAAAPAPAAASAPPPSAATPRPRPRPTTQPAARTAAPVQLGPPPAAAPPRAQ